MGSSIKLVLLFMILSGFIFAVDISSCQVINSPGDYDLIADLNSSATCIDITSDDVLLDCHGFSISGEWNDSAVSLTGDNITVQNCLMDHYGDVIYADDVTNSRIINNTITYPEGHGIKVLGGPSTYNLEILNNTIKDYALSDDVIYGRVCSGSEPYIVGITSPSRTTLVNFQAMDISAYNTTIAGNTIANLTFEPGSPVSNNNWCGSTSTFNYKRVNSDGIYTYGSGFVIANNTVNRSAAGNIQSDLRVAYRIGNLYISSSDTEIYGNVISDAAGIFTYSNSNVTIHNNTIVDNEDQNYDAILMEATSNSDIFENMISGYQNGIIFERSSYNTASDNRIVGANYRMSSSGIQVIYGSDYINITGNEISDLPVYGFGGDAIRIVTSFAYDDSEHILIQDNYLHDNIGAGIFLEASANAEDQHINNITVINNQIYNNMYGVIVNGPTLGDVAIENNTINNSRAYDFMRNGYMLSSTGGVDAFCGFGTFTNNTNLNGKEILYSNTQITLQNNNDYSEIVLCNADGSILENVIVDGSETNYNNGLILLYTDNAVLTNVNSSNNNNGMIAFRSENLTVQDSYFENSKRETYRDVLNQVVLEGFYGYVGYSDGVTSGSIQIVSSHGVSLLYSPNAYFDNTKINNNTGELATGISFYASDNFTLNNSEVDRNQESGIIFGSTFYNLTILNSQINDNKRVGIFFSGQAYGAVFENTEISGTTNPDNEYYEGIGIYSQSRIENSSFNNVSFIDNNNGGMYAYRLINTLINNSLAANNTKVTSYPSSIGSFGLEIRGSNNVTIDNLKAYGNHHNLWLDSDNSRVLNPYFHSAYPIGIRNSEYDIRFEGTMNITNAIFDSPAADMSDYKNVSILSESLTIGTARYAVPVPPPIPTYVNPVDNLVLEVDSLYTGRVIPRVVFHYQPSQVSGVDLSKVGAFYANHRVNTYGYQGDASYTNVSNILTVDPIENQIILEDFNMNSSALSSSSYIYTASILIGEQLEIPVNHPPIMVLYPPNNSVYSSSISYVQLRYTAYDDNSTTALCRIYVDGSLRNSRTATMGTSYSYNSYYVSPGIHEWRLNCTDTQGLSANVTYYYLVQDSVAPTVTITAPAENSTLLVPDGTVIPISYTLADNAASLSCSIYVEGLLNQTQIVSPGSRSFNVAFNEGQHNVGITCDDGFNNGSDSVSFSTTAPELPEVENVTLHTEFGTNLSSEDLIVDYDLNNPSYRGIPAWYLDGNPYMSLYLPMEGNPSDYSGSGTATSLSGAGYSATGGYNGSGTYYFDGTNDYISTSLNIDQSSSSGGVTFMAWVYPMSTSSGEHHVISSDDGGWDWSLLRIGNQWHYATGNSYQNTNRPVTLNTWQHLAVVYNPAASRIDFYMDGVLYSSTGLYSARYDTSDANINIGRNPTFGQYFQGRLDDVMILERPLSAGQVQAFYTYSRNDHISSQETSPFQTWQSCITPTDGVIYGSTVCSNNVTLITYCPHITTSGNHVLTRNTTGIAYSVAGPVAANACVWIDADNVVFDCNGFSLSHNNESGTAAIHVEGDNVTIQNCEITDYYAAIQSQQANGLTILDSNLTHPYYAVFDYNSNDTELRNIDITALNPNTNGIYLINDNGALIDSVAMADGYALVYASSSSNIVINNSEMVSTVNGNSYGVYASGTNNLTVTNNNFTVTAYGVSIYTSTGTSVLLVENNRFDNYPRYGVYSNYQTEAKINNNYITAGSGYNAIQMYSSSGNPVTSPLEITNNQIVGRPGSPMYYGVSSYSAPVFIENNTFENAQYVVYLTGSSNSTINNVDAVNSTYGFTVYSGNNVSVTNSNIQNSQFGMQTGSLTNSLLENVSFTGIMYSGTYLQSSNNMTVRNVELGAAPEATYGFYAVGQQSHLDNVHIYGFTNDVYYSYGIFNATALVIDNPLGNFENFTNLSVHENASSNIFSINWSAPVTPPSGLASFENKYVSINTGGNPLDTVIWSWTDGEVVGYDESSFQVQFNNGTWNPLATSTGTNSLSGSAPGDGTYAILYEQDITPPNVSLISPANGSILNNALVDFEYNATDAHLDYCNVFADGAITADPAVLAQGGHSWNVTCYDLSGNNASTDTWEFSIDSIAPSIVLISPVDGTSLNDSTVDFDYNVSENSTCTVYLDGGVASDPANVTDGIHAWSVECLDSAGNSGSSGNNTFTIDTTAPAVTLVYPPDGSTLNDTLVDFGYSATDANLDSCTVFADGSASSDPANLTEGGHSWYVSCSDLVGNSATTGSWNFTIDTSVPSTTPSDDKDSNKKRLDFTVLSSCKGTVVDTGVEGVGVVVINDKTLEAVSSGITEEGLFQFSACGSDVRISASKDGYMPIVKKQSLPLCSECIGSPEPPAVEVTPEPQFECLSDSDCADAYYCSEAGSCLPVTGSCGFAQNHAWSTYECGNEPGCPACDEGYSCSENACVPLNLSGPVEDIIGNEVEIEATEGSGPCSLCDLVIIAPDGRQFTGKTSQDGKFMLPLTVEGTYRITLVKDGENIKTINLNAVAPEVPVDVEKPVEKDEGDLSCLFLFILLLVLVAIWLYKNRKKR